MNARAFTRVQLWAAVCLVAAFFMPWISLGGFKGFASLAGYQTSDVIKQHTIQKIESKQTDIKRLQNAMFIFNGDAPELFNHTPTAEQSAQTQQKISQWEKEVAELQISLAFSYALYAIPLLGFICFLSSLGGTGGFRRRFMYFLGGSVALGILAFFYLKENDDGKFLQEASIGIWLTAISGAVLLVSVVLPAQPVSTKEVAVEAVMVPSIPEPPRRPKN